MFVSSDPVFCVAFDPQKPNILASGSRDKTIKIWDVESGACQSTLGGDKAVHCVSFSPDGDMLAAGHGEHYRAGNVRLYDVQTGEVKLTLTGHAGYVPAFPCSACSRSRVVCSLFSDAQGSLGRLLRQDRKVACLIQ